jgi:hypothetical protein
MLRNMPEISRFLGIIISMYYKDHEPPHFHARYGDHRATFGITDLQLLEGQLPRRVSALVLEWAFEHRAELAHDWELARQGARLQPVAPLV